MLVSPKVFKKFFLSWHKFNERSLEEKKIILENARTYIGFAHFPTETLLVKKQSANGNYLTLQQCIAHEELHLWCKKEKIDDAEYSRSVNEQFFLKYMTCFNPYQINNDIFKILIQYLFRNIW